LSRKHVAATIGILVTGMTGAALAQTQPPLDRLVTPGTVPTAAVLDSAFAQQLQRMEGTRIGLEEAVKLALENSTEVAQAAATLAAAEGVLRREKGGFDPEVFATALRTSEEIPTSSPFAPVESNDRVEGVVGAGMTLKTGTNIVASARTTRQTTQAGFESLSPKYDSRAGVDIRQPLLQGFGIAAHGELTASEHELEAARANFEGTRLSVRSQVERTYWDLYAAERDVAVGTVVREGAAALEESAERRARTGLVGPNQVANARVFLAGRETVLLDLAETHDQISDQLSTLIGAHPDAGARSWRPTQEPPHDFPLAPEDSVVALALTVNYTLHFLDATIAAAATREEAAGRDALPVLDLLGSVAGSGLAGRGRDLTFGDTTISNDLDTNFNDSWKQVFQGDFPTWSAGLRFSMPIGRRAGTGERDRRRALVAFAEQQHVAAQRSLEEVVRARYRDLEHAEERLGFARNGAEAAFEQARIGRLEFDNGRTTAFELVRLAGDLATAQQIYSQALVRAAKAAAQLRELTAGAYPPATAP
jgi:outer membrane protein TolC